MDEFLTAKDLEVLSGIYPSGTCSVWGVTPGEENINEPKWERIEEGDVTYSKVTFAFK
jgi:hypothetical protein